MRWLGRVLLVAAAYCAAGRLALLLAIPPGYATSVWPAAGIALTAVLIWGVRVWPGVLVGSFFVNIWTSFQGGSLGAVATSVGIASGIGVGAALQAIAGALLIRRFVGFPTALTQEREIGKFLALGGPLSCLVNATISVSTLLIGGVIAWPQYAFSWWTWWVGDTIGVLLVTPLALVSAREPTGVWRKRRTPVVSAVLLCSALVVALFVHANKQEEHRTHSDFKLRTDRLADAVRADLTAFAETLHAVRSFYDNAREIDRQAFRNLVQRFLERHPGIRALSWNPRVEDRERPAYEEAARRDGFASFRFSEVAANGHLVPAARRSEYFPVYFIEPHQGNEVARGYDIASEASRLEALVRARNSGELATTERITLVQETVHQFGVLGLVPIYSGTRSTAAENRGLRGFAVGVFRIGDMIASSLRGLDQEGIDLRLIDTSAPTGARVLGSFRSGTTQEIRPSGGILVEAPIDFGGRRWVLAFSPSPEYAFRHKGWEAWAVLAVGLLFTSFLGAFLLVVTGRTVAVEQLVEARTSELARSETQLRMVLETAHDAFIAINPEGRIVEWNPRAEAIFGWSRTEAVGRALADTIIPQRYREAHRVGLQRFLTTGEGPVLGKLLELEALHRDGHEFPVELTISAVRLENAWRFNAFVSDITDRKQAAERLIALREKEVLLKEVHHRVKNNLQVVSSLLNLQSLRESPEVARMLEEMQGRVRAIALFHEKIYRAEDVTGLGLADYLRDLTDWLLHQHSGGSERVRVQVDGAEVRLGVDKAIPCGLIANELVSNALKHAFPNGRGGTIRIAIARLDDGRVELSVTDDGVGIPEGDIGRVSTLGLKLVSGLAKQLGGDVELTRDGGTCLRVRFPAAKT